MPIQLCASVAFFLFKFVGALTISFATRRWHNKARCACIDTAYLICACLHRQAYIVLIVRIYLYTDSLACVSIGSGTIGWYFLRRILSTCTTASSVFFFVRFRIHELFQNCRLLFGWIAVAARLTYFCHHGVGDAGFFA